MSIWKKLAQMKLPRGYNSELLHEAAARGREMEALLREAPAPRKHGIETHTEMLDWYDRAQEALNND